VTSETLPITSKNAAGQLVAVVNQSSYDAFGNKTTTTEAAGLPEQRVTQFKYDGLNREIEQRQALVNTYVDGRSWQLATPTRTSTYDANGNLIVVVDPNGGRTRTWFDASNRKVAEVSATGTLSQWTYDAAGNQMTREVEARLDAGTGGLKGANSTTDYTLMKDGTLSSVDSTTNTFDNRSAAVKAADPNPEPNGGFNITRTINNYAYAWWDSGKQTAITMGSASTAYNPQRPQPPGYSMFGYDVNGHLKTATDINRTTPRTFSYWTNAEGQVLQRQELIGGTVAADGSVSGATKSRDHRYFYFDGKRVGNIGNDGVEREDYAQQLARSADAASPDAKYRKFMPTNSADFDENYQPVNAGYPGPAPGSYTVRSGDTLEGIARALWGDAQLWYLLADANGLDGHPTAAKARSS